MKKKLLAALFSLLMIAGLATGTYAGKIIPGTDIVVTNPDGTADLLSSRMMYDECPECGYDYALFYAYGMEIRYYCKECGAKGIAYQANYRCICEIYGDECTCKIVCACGQTKLCGTTCGNCGRFVTCPKNCETCEKPTKPSYPGPDNWWNGFYPDNWWNGDDDYYGDYWTDENWNCWWDWDKQNARYLVTISSNIAGGTYDVSGGYFGRPAELKTVTINEKPGYALTDVSINGVSYGPVFQFDLRMNRNYYINLTFTQVNLYRDYTVTASSTGNGRITLVKNGGSVKNPSAITADYSDTLTYRFLPGGSNYYVKDVKVNGKSLGSRTSYTITKIQSNIKIQATFAWKCPYSDVSANHMAAVEYVTEAGIMSSINRYLHTDIFKGTNSVSVKTFVAALAEMTDTEDELDTVADRVAWAVEAGLIDEDDDTSATITVRTACTVMKKYLSVLEEENGVTFVGNKSRDSAKETCIALNLVSDAAYQKNAAITRYNLAELCYAISNLDYED